MSIITVSSKNLGVAATQHAIGDAVGGPIPLFIDATQGTIRHVTLKDTNGATNSTSTYDVIFFRTQPAAATITDDSALVLSTDIANVIDSVSLAGMVVDSTQGFVATECDIDFDLKADGDRYLWAAIRANVASTFLINGVTLEVSVKV